MNNFNHDRLVRAISKLGNVPSAEPSISEWLLAKPHVSLLEVNSGEDEVIIHALGKDTFINTVVVPNDDLFPLDRDDLLRWNINPYGSIASYVSGGPDRTTWIERGSKPFDSKSLEHAMTLVFGRTFQGWSKPGGDYFELNQEYSHLTEIHWRPEADAYCRYDSNGDLEPVVSITTAEKNRNGVTLVSFKWRPLEEYLAASNSSLVRMFDFTMQYGSTFTAWPVTPEERHDISPELFFNRKVMPNSAGYTRGVQILRARREHRQILSGISEWWCGNHEREHAEFIAYDWRNGVTRKISTNPSSTANYFNAQGNSLPYETSPVFFRPEVLLKYKTDRDKYTVSERDISCRTAWHLKAIDVNEAGQIHAYICYLRNLPHSEQLHWLSFNEAPKGGISSRAIICDFEGKFTGPVEPLQQVIRILQGWKDSKKQWWTLRDERLVQRVNTPLTASQDEWADSFLELSKLVVEGFETVFLRQELERVALSYSKDERTLDLLEKLLRNKDLSGQMSNLSGMRMVQRIRNKLRGHVSGNEAHQIAQEALTIHRSFANHFRHICAEVATELATIETLFRS